ncbi:MAG: response regulator [bacterium]
MFEKWINSMLPKFLVLDDCEHFLELYERFLTETFPGAIVKKAINNKNAWSILKNFYPDIIITDLAHPGEDGYEFLVKIRRDPKKCSIPVICISGCADALLRRGGGNGEQFNAILTKPMELQILTDCIMKFLSC